MKKTTNLQHISNNIVRHIRVPFPPQVTVDEIVQKLLDNGVENYNKTPNSFIIYRKAYIHEATKFGFLGGNISKLAKDAWDNEPERIKNFYREMEKDIKAKFKRSVPPPFFFYTQRSQKRPRHTNCKVTAVTTKDAFRISQKSTSHPQAIVITSHSVESFYTHLNIHMNISDEAFINSLSNDLALTYKAIIDSLSSLPI
ncbi:3311_t:CDS:1 [Acaulospora morrowiae]|uniref:3311_t:CDS:1 n=1 Tax=Acaulospora morrowiae TaxID=94023 RepID=A0A9N9FL23_9GLOM|nr:3311_t:CDS:1 [Acaulospora morrowiae]